MPPTSILVAVGSDRCLFGKEERTHLRTPALRIAPRTMGTIWVKEKPESTTRTHSGIGCPRSGE